MSNYSELLTTLEARFKAQSHRHENLSWKWVAEHLSDEVLAVIEKMEASGGEPDAVCLNGKLHYVDLCTQSPKERANTCYDEQARIGRKNNAPLTSALEMAVEMGIEILDEYDYREIQKLEALDTKTSSWIYTPKDIRELGGALFCDRRYNTVFVYHNGADSWYGSRGFRGKLKL